MTKIDDEMVERAAKAMANVSPDIDEGEDHGDQMCEDKNSFRCTRTYGPCRCTRHLARKALEAALSPKPEPEIEVTEGMLRAGLQIWLHLPGEDEDQIAAIYRAMESTRLKEAQEGAAYAAKPAPQGVNAAAPVKETGGGVAYVYWDKNDRRQRGVIVWNDRRVGDRRGRDRFIKANADK